MDNYSRKVQNGKNTYSATRRQTPVHAYPWRTPSLYLYTTTQVPEEVQVKKWFEKHKSVALGVAFVSIIFMMIIIVYCCRQWYRKDKRQQARNSGKSRSLAFSHEEYQLPRWSKSSVQPRQNKQQEIKELGTIHFSLKYDRRRSRLNVNILRGEDLPLISSSNVSFTYVVVELQPFSQKYEAKAQTRYARNSISPAFNDTIHYEIPVEELQQQTLLLCVYDINHLSAHDLIGRVRINVDGPYLATGAEKIYKEKLKFEDSSKPVGEILVGLRWKKDKETLEITVQEASCLRVMDNDKLTASPYVKLQVYINSFLVLKKRTKVEKRTSSPKFRKVFSVHIPEENLSRNTQLVLTVKHVAKFRRKHVIGQLYFGIDGKGSASEQWEIIRKSSDYVEMWHELHAPLDDSRRQPRSKVNYLLFEDNNSDDNLSSAELSDRSDIRSDSALLGYNRSF